MIEHWQVAQFLEEEGVTVKEIELVEHNDRMIRCTLNICNSEKWTELPYCVDIIRIHLSERLLYVLLNIDELREYYINLKTGKVALNDHLRELRTQHNI